MPQKPRLTPTMRESEFDNGYWYVGELRTFAAELEIPAANKLRKDELERAIKHFLRTGETKSLIRRKISKSRERDVDKGLALDLPVVDYTSNKETKQFIEREAAKLAPSFKRASGTRYLLNRWREEQLARGRRITYRDLVVKAIELTRTKSGPLRLEHGRYMNFVSDFMAANEKASRGDVVKAWQAVKRMNAPKTYAAWAKQRKRRK